MPKTAQHLPYLLLLPLLPVVIVSTGCSAEERAARPAVSRPAVAPPAALAGPAPQYAEVLYAGSDQNFPNPERGFYHYVELLEDDTLDYVVEADHRLVYSYVRLDDYRERSLPESLLAAIEKGLAVARRAGVKVILRFAYNFGPYPDSEPDAPRPRILEHIGQLHGLLESNVDVIAVLQAGFIGAWGEWHTSTNKLLKDATVRQEILEALLDALPSERMTQLRYPAYKREMYGAPLTAAQAFDGSYAARVGHHNDCFLAGRTDEGTYPENEVSALEDYVARDTRYVVMGGETCKVFARRTNCATTLKEMERLHYSFINQDYHEDVVESWKKDGCFETIERSLGYQIRLVRGRIPTQASPGGAVELKLVFRNTGWAAPYNPRPVYLILSRGDGRRELLLKTVDPRRWTAGAELTVREVVQIPDDLVPGEYRLALWLPDAAESLQKRPIYAIRLANEGLWDASTAEHRLGMLRVETAR